MTMGGDDDLVIRARVDNDASAELRDIQDDLRDVGTTARTTGRQATASSRGFSRMGRAGRIAARGLKVAFGATLVAGYAAVRLLQSSFGEAREAQRVGRATAQIIKQTGGAAKVSEKQVGKLAGKLSRMAGVDDELIQGGANLLLTFKKIRNEVGKGNKVFDRATAAALDLSSLDGMGSIEGAAKMLGKALNDPLKGITALSRAGVQFTEEQKAQIAAMVETGNMLGAQKLILGEVESQVGGLAKAQATWSDKAAVAIGNVKEKLGTALLPTLEKVSRWFVREGAPALEDLVDKFTEDGIPAIKDFGEQARDFAEKNGPKLKRLLGNVRDVIVPVAKGARNMVNAFLDMPGWAQKAIAAGGLGALAAGKLGLNPLKGGGSGGGLLGLATKAKPLPVFVVNNGIGVPDKPGKPGAGKPGKFPTFLAGFGLPVIAGVGGGLAAAANDPENHNALAPGSGGYGGDGGMTLPPSVQNTNDLDKAGDSFRAWVSSVFGGADAEAEDFTQTAAESRASLEALLSPVPGADRVKGDLNNNLTAPMQLADVLAGDLSGSLDTLGGKRPRPKVDAPGLDTALTGADRLLATLTRLDGFNARTSITTYRSTVGTGVGPAYNADDPNPKGRRALGGRVLAGKDYLVGEKRAEIFRPDRAGRILPRAEHANTGGSGITIEAGAIVVTVDRPANNVDVAQAVADGIRDYVREREERG